MVTMNRRRWTCAAIGGTVLLLLIITGCKDYAHYAITPCPTPPYSLYGTAAMANIQADHAQQTASAMQMTAQAVNVLLTQEVHKTVAAREQWAFEQTQAAVAATGTTAAMQATQTAAANATGTAIAYAQATATTQAAQTATAVYYAQATAEAAPTATLVAAQTAALAERLEWERRTAPILRILQVALYAALTLIGVVALVWLIPRAWHALMLRLLAFRTGSPDMPLVLAVASRGVFRAWTQAPQLTAYNADRDGGPGQAIDLASGEARALPGGNPMLARGDQIVDTVTRPVAAAAQAGRSLHPGRAVQAAARLQRESRPYVILPPTETPPPQIADQVGVLDARWEEVADG